MNNFSDKRAPILPFSGKVISLSEKAARFVDSVVSLRPATAVFDCDDTLWKGDSGKGFMDWEIENKIVSDKGAGLARVRYGEYVQGKVSEEDMCGEMVAWHGGLKIATLEEAGERYVVEMIEKRIFPEMQELVARLLSTGCDIWAVSSTNEWVIRAGVKRYGIRADHVLAVSIESKNGIATEKLIRVRTGEGKAVAGQRIISEEDYTVVANSVSDKRTVRELGSSTAMNS